LFSLGLVRIKYLVIIFLYYVDNLSALEFTHLEFTQFFSIYFSSRVTIVCRYYLGFRLKNGIIFSKSEVFHCIYDPTF
jgi:hypothetical protein